jgi:hypothetical protein
MLFLSLIIYWGEPLTLRDRGNHQAKKLMVTQETKKLKKTHPKVAQKKNIFIFVTH